MLKDLVCYRLRPHLKKLDMLTMLMPMKLESKLLLSSVKVCTLKHHSVDVT